MAAAACHCCPCFSSPGEILATRADVVLYLLDGFAEWMSRSTPAPATEPGGWKKRPDGNLEMNVTSIDQLSALLRRAKPHEL